MLASISRPTWVDARHERENDGDKCRTCRAPPLSTPMNGRLRNGIKELINIAFRRIELSLGTVVAALAISDVKCNI